MLFRNNSANRVDYIAEDQSRIRAFYSDNAPESVDAAPLFFDDPAKVTALYDAGISSEVLTTTIGIAQKSTNWIKLQFESKLLNKVEKCSPDILFDLEKKFEFTGLVTTELSAFSAGFVKAATALDQAIKNNDEETASLYAVACVDLIMIFLGRMNQHYADYGHFFGNQVYNQFRSKLNLMKVDERRLVDAFFTKFETSVSVMRRVFDQEIPNARASKSVTLDHVFRWLTQVSQSINAMYNCAHNIVSA